MAFLTSGNRINVTAAIDWINVFLIALSLLIAIILPFQLFIISYAILGPLHYLTEIVWLKDKNYFILSKQSWSLIFILFALLLSAYPIWKYMAVNPSESTLRTMDYFKDAGGILLLSGFLFAICLIISRKKQFLMIAFVFCLAISILCSKVLPYAIILISVFLPTIIHVYVFTLLFILYGAKKSNGISGYINAFFLFIVPLLILFIDTDPENYSLTNSAIIDYQSINFQTINLTIANILVINPSEFSLASTLGIKIQIFIAFAYTYHYLNWFSKTSVIGWNKALTNRRTLIIIILWIISVAIYLYDMKTGFIVLLFLSFLHVFLEFPLNVTTIKSLFIGSSSKDA